MLILLVFCFEADDYGVFLTNFNVFVAITGTCRFIPLLPNGVPVSVINVIKLSFDCSFLLEGGGC